MSTIDLATGIGAGLPKAMTADDRFIYDEVSIDLDTAEAGKGSALAANDIIEAIDIPAYSVILAAGLEVTTAQSGSVALTLDLGVTGVDVDAYVDGFDLVAASAGDTSQQPAAYQPIVVWDADTLDLLIASLTTTNTGGVVRVWVVYADITAAKAPGIAAIGS